MIHYHGLPMFPVLSMARAFTCHHAMVSFEAPAQMEIAAEVCQSVVLDNGAFSAWKKGKPLDFDGYVTWAEKWLKHPAVDWCVIPDVIDGDAAANDEMLERWELPAALSVPVFHMHEPLSRLIGLALEYPRVALGSSGAFSDPGTREWWVRMSDMMTAVCDADGMPYTKLHGLRMLDTKISSRIPLSSADSCNVARNCGIDQKWNGRYAPKAQHVRAQVMMDRIERHASASHWSPDSTGEGHNLELLG